jgi:hypothetical protein
MHDNMNVNNVFACFEGFAVSRPRRTESSNTYSFCRTLECDITAVMQLI